MKKSTKIWRIVLGVLFLVSGLGAIGKYSAWVVIATLLIGAAIFPWTAFTKPKSLKDARPVENASTPNETETIAQNIALLSKSCRYSYTDVGLYRPDDAAPMPKLGDVLILELEEDNPYDPKAVRAVRWERDGLKVYGYMNKGKLRDMVTDFIQRGDTIMTQVTRADDKLEIWIGMP